MSRKERQMRNIEAGFKTREENNELIIEGYFAVFNSNYEIFPGATESISDTAFNEALNDDIRCLIDHETRLVLGRNRSGTLMLSIDEKGLYGVVKINPNDQDAMNLYERVKRGDVNQCSFGFDILDEEYEEKPDGSVHWTIHKVKLYEVSIVTFPAYESTSVIARKDDLKQINKRKIDVFKQNLRKKLKGE